MLSRKSGLPLGTRNSMVPQETFFESLPAREGPSLAVFEKSKNLASSSCGLASGNTAEHWKVVRRDLQELLEISDLGTASWNIPRLIAVSKLGSQHRD